MLVPAIGNVILHTQKSTRTDFTVSEDLASSIANVIGTAVLKVNVVPSLYSNIYITSYQLRTSDSRIVTAMIATYDDTNYLVKHIHCANL
jgi:hypothetical protein